MIEGIVITKTTNPLIQDALYKAGLVANEDYSLQEEVEKITADQLQPGTTYSTSIFYSLAYKNIGFEEFKYFTNVTEIKPYTFYYMYIDDGRDIILPNSIKTIKQNAFYDGYFWGKIHLPPSIETMESDAFTQTQNASFGGMVIYDLEKFLQIKVGGLNSFPTYQAQYGTGGEEKGWVYLGDEKIVDLVLPSTITSIPKYFFHAWNKIESVYIPDSVTSIDTHTFHSCRNLKRVLGAKNITSMPNVNGPFRNCGSIEYIDPNANIVFGSIDDSLISCIRYMNYSYSFYRMWSHIQGTHTFTCVSGAYFEDMSTSKTVQLPASTSVYNLTEILKIGYITFTIKSNKPDAHFRIDYTNVNGNESFTIVEGAGSHIVPCKLSTKATITAITDYEGLTPSKIHTINSTSAENTATIDYIEKTDIYIQHIDGTLYTTDEWTAGGYANDQANGVAVVCASASFVIAKTTTSTAAKWSSDTRNLVEGVFTTETKSVVLTDFAGAANTALMLATDTSGAAYLCDNYTFPNGAKGYLPASGELNVAYQNKASINAALILIGGDTLISYIHWTSTQHSAGKAWRLSLSNGNISDDTKAGAITVLAFTSLN